MPGTSLQTILSTENLSGVIQKVKPGLPVECVPAQLINPTGAMVRNVTGNYATFRTDRGVRKTARHAASGSPSRNRSMTGVGEQQIKLITPRENFELNATSLQNLQSNDGVKQRMGESEVTRQLAESRQYLENSRAAAVFSALAIGTINYDVDGNILPSTTNAVVSVDQGIPAGNRNQVGGIIDSTWSNANANIPQQMINLQKYSLQLSGHRIKEAMYGSGVLSNILQNNYCREMFRANPALLSQFATNLIPDGFLGIDKWYPAYEAFWENDAGTNVEPFGANQVTFIPTPSESWYEMTIGSTPIPRDLNVGSDALAAVANLLDVTGYFSYAYLTPDPVQARTVYGDCFLPFIKTPTAVFQVTTVF